MRIDLIYIEGEHPTVPGLIRHFETNNLDADHRVKDIFDRGGKVYRQLFSVQVDEAFSRLEMEAALCVWEYLCEITVCCNTPDPKWFSYRNNVGSVELRHESMEIGKWALKVYDLLPEWYRDGKAYDWEIIPDIVGQVTPGCNCPNPRFSADKLVTSDEAKQEYLRSAKWWLEQDYCIDDFGMTDEDFFHRWFIPSIDPKEAVRHYAEKYELEKFKK